MLPSPVQNAPPLPKDVSDILRMDSKYAVQPELSPPELLALNRNIARRAPADEEETCIQEGAASLLKKVHTSKRRPNLRAVSEFLDSNQLHLLVAEKEGGFVVASKEEYASRAEQAMRQNFIEVSSDPKALKKQATSICKNLDLQGLLKGFKDCSPLSLRVFFAAKTHKPESPFRAIISEREALGKDF